VKYLVLLVIVYFVFSYIRRQRQRSDSLSKDFPNSNPQIMIKCDECGVHFPKTDAFAGRQGSYCCSAHLKAKENI